MNSVKSDVTAILQLLNVILNLQPENKQSKLTHMEYIKFNGKSNISDKCSSYLFLRLFVIRPRT